MARLITAGAEGGHPHVDGSTTITGSFTAVTTAAAIRSGSYGYNASSGAGNAAAWASYSGLGGALNRNYYIRAYVKIPSGTGYPTANTRIISFQDTNPTATAQVRLNTDGTVNLVGGGGGTIGSASSALSQDDWHLIELRVQLKVGNDEAELKVDNVAVASTTTTAFSDTNPGRVIFGMIDAPGANKTLYFDDLAVNDDQGASENTWPDANGKIVALLPVSISAKGTWAGGAGGTTDANMITAVSTRPPAGTASETDSTQIECSTSAGSTITFVTDTYTAAGIGGSDTITLMRVVAETGEDASAGSENATVSGASNPSITGGTDLFGPAAGGALGTYPTNWAVVSSDIAYAPSPTLGTGASISIAKGNTSNRVYSCCFIAAMVEYIPAVGGGPAATMALDGVTTWVAIPKRVRKAAINISGSGGWTAVAKNIRRAFLVASGTTTWAVLTRNVRAAKSVLSGTTTWALIGTSYTAATMAWSGQGDWSLVGTVVTAGGTEELGSASWSGSGDWTARAVSVRVSKLDLSAQSTWVAKASDTRIGKIAADGVTTWALVPHRVRNAAIAADGSGAWSTRAISVRVAKAAWDGTTTWAARAISVRVASLVLSGSTTWTARAISTRAAKAVLSGTTTWSAIPHALRYGVLTIAGSGSWALDGTRLPAGDNGVLNISGAGTWTLRAIVTHVGKMALDGSGLLTLRPIANKAAKAALDGSGAWTALPHRDRASQAVFSGTGTWLALGSRFRYGVMPLSAQSTWTARAISVRVAALALSGQGAWSAIPQRERYAVAAWSGSSAWGMTGGIILGFRPVTGKGAWSGDGAWAARYVSVRAAKMVLSGQGTASVRASRTAKAVAAWSGDGAVKIVAGIFNFGVIALSGATTWALIPHRLRNAQITLGGGANTVWWARKTTVTRMALDGRGEWAARGGRVRTGVAAWSGVGSWSVAPNRVQVGAAAWSGIGALSSLAHRDRIGSMAWSGQTTWITSATSIFYHPPQSWIMVA